MAQPTVVYKVVFGSDGSRENGNYGSDPEITWTHNLNITPSNATVKVHKIMKDGKTSWPVLITDTVTVNANSVVIALGHDADNYEAYFITLAYN